MEPILSKQEIADLLQTLQQDGPARSRQGSTERYGSKYEHPEINLFDLPSKVQQRSEIANFNLIIDQFQTVFSRSLAQHLQRTVTIKDIDSQLLPFQEYLSFEDRYRPTGVLTLKPLNNGCLLTFDSHLWFLLIEILLGGVDTSGMTAPDRTPTKLEMKMLNSSMELVCQALDRAFLPILVINSRLIETIGDPKQLSFTSPDSLVTIHRFQIQIEEYGGFLELVFPLETLAPCRSPLQKLTRLNRLGDKNWPDIITATVEDMPLTIMAQSCSVDLSIRQLIELKVGDIIPIGREPESSVDVLVEGVPKLSGTTEQRKHKKYIIITEPYQLKEEL